MYIRSVHMFLIYTTSTLIDTLSTRSINRIYIENLINGMKKENSIEFKSRGDTFVITVERKKIVDPLECRPLKLYTVRSSTYYHQHMSRDT